MKEKRVNELNSSRGRMVSGCAQLLFIMTLILGLGSSVIAADCEAVHKAFQQEHNPQKRRKLIAAAILKCPNDPIVNYKYGLSQERFRKYEKALGYYKTAARLNPTMAKAYGGMGDVYVQLGLLDEAIKAYSKAVAGMPDSERFNRRLKCLVIKRKALHGEVLTAGEFIEVMYHRGKISSSMSLLLRGPALQYKMAFVGKSGVLLPTGVRQLAAVGQGIQNDALKGIRFEISTHVAVGGTSLEALEDSKARAQMIKERLVTNFKIDPNRLEIAWYGDAQPLPLESAGVMLDVGTRVEFRRVMK